MSLSEYCVTLQQNMSFRDVQRLLRLWGDSAEIKISVVEGMLYGDRILTKKILKLGIDVGIFRRGYHYTYKIIRSEDKQFMKQWGKV